MIGPVIYQSKPPIQGSKEEDERSAFQDDQLKSPLLEENDEYLRSIDETGIFMSRVPILSAAFSTQVLISNSKITKPASNYVQF